MLGTLVLLYHLNYIFYCDNFYQNNTLSYNRHGGSSEIQYSCGLFSVTSNRDGTHTGWHTGANLSFIFLLFIVIIFIKLLELIMVFVVVTVVMDSFVVFSLFILEIHFLMLAGIVVLLYHLNQL